MGELELLVKIDALKGQLRALTEENATLRYERDLARADARALIPKATPEEEAEFRQQADTAVPNGLANLIAELETGGVTRGN
jgi:regulator of replication initiation timing